jgi:TRIAP1/MDM35 family protein
MSLDMASSLSPKCTPLKNEYDSCFNAWFEGYLEPATAASATPEQRSAFSKQKAEEFDRNCGKIWEQYRDCVQVSV